MEVFDEVIKVADVLNSERCPWGVTQTLESVARYVLEEAHEVVDALHNSSDEHLREELGDLLYTIIFCAKVAERQQRFTLHEIIDGLHKKLVRRHAYAFEGHDFKTPEDVLVHWEKVKKAEKKDIKGLFDDIPKDMPILMRASKIVKRIRKHHPELIQQKNDFGHRFIELIMEAQEAGVDPESSLRESLATYQKMVDG